MPWVGLQGVVVVFPDHTQLLHDIFEEYVTLTIDSNGHIGNLNTFKSILIYTI